MIKSDVDELLRLSATHVDSDPGLEGMLSLPPFEAVLIKFISASGVIFPSLPSFCAAATACAFVMLVKSYGVLETPAVLPSPVGDGVPVAVAKAEIVAVSATFGRCGTGGVATDCRFAELEVWDARVDMRAAAVIVICGLPCAGPSPETCKRHATTDIDSSRVEWALSIIGRGRFC